jgi:CHAT domain-containing protein
LAEGQGDHDKALDLYERSLAIKQDVFGRTHPTVANAINNIAQIYRKQDRLPEAESAQIQSLEILENCVGTDNPWFLIGLSNLGIIYVASDNLQEALVTFARLFPCLRRYSAGQLSGLPEPGAVKWQQGAFFLTEVFQTLCESPRERSNSSPLLGAEQLSLTKAFAEEVQAVRSAIESDSKVVTQELRNRYADVRAKLARLPETVLSREQAGLRRRQLTTELNEVETKLAEQVGLVAQTLRERTLTLPEIGRALSTNAVLLDLVQYRRYDFAVQTNQWREQRYAAYLTFSLANDSTDVVVERVDLGEAAPINEALGIIAKRFSAVPPQYRARDVQPALQKLSDLVYAPLAKHLRNVSHLIICPDGQLSRLPFEMLPVGNKFLVEEKTISYVTSGREVVRLANSKSNVQSSESLVMGNPDFDLDLNVAQAAQPASSAGIPARSSSDAKQDASEFAGRMPALRSLSRDYRGLKFTPLRGAEAEARSVAMLLGNGTILRLGADAREAELKAVQSPRVLHLATHGFFLSDQEFRETNGIGGFAQRSPFAIGTTFASLGTIGPRWKAALPQNDWENPLVRCGIALAGANRAQQISNAIAEDGVLTGLEASLLNLQGTELVILSACQSGAGEVKIGEGVMSLRRAFRIAGAQTVLASHWSVSDKATSQLMTEFMRRWRAGEPRAKAWREAQLSLLRPKGAKEDFSNPFFWSAFTLTGQWR